MTPEQQIKALAELDGWTEIHQSTLLLEFGVNNSVWAGRMPDKDFLAALPNYLTSYDAIIPLIQKKFTKHSCHSFFDALGIIAAKNTADCDGQYEYQGDGSYYEQWLLFKATPAQFSEALLRATGKWTE